MEPLCGAVLEKIEEQIDRMLHLAGMLRSEDLEWQPPVAGSWTPARLLGHLNDCLAGFCAVLMAANPKELAHFSALRELPPDRACSPDEFRARIAVYRSSIEQGFAILRDADLARVLPTVFMPGGQTVLALMLGNLEHLINHKHQLFTYLKVRGIAAGTPDLYVIYNPPPPLSANSRHTSLSPESPGLEPE